jgi:hypothetical protein
MIIDCLKEYDNSIKKKALDLLFLITTKDNVESIVKELLNILLETDEELLHNVT